MVTADNYALNNECGPNNEVLRISSYHSIIHGKCVNSSVNVKETSYVAMATQEAEYSLESDVRGHHVYKYIWTACLAERLSLRTDMGDTHDSYHTMLLGHHVYKYIWTACLAERLSLRTDMGDTHDSYHTMLFR